MLLFNIHWMAQEEHLLDCCDHWGGSSFDHWSFWSSDQSIMSLHPISAAAHNIQEETTTGVSSCSSLQCCALLIILRECVNNRSSPVLLCTSYVNIYFWIVGFLEELLFSQSFEDHSLYVQWIYYWADLDGDKCSKALCTRLERIRKPSFPVSWVWRKYLPLQLF